MNRRRRTLPPVPPKAPSELRPLIAAMTEILETGEGVRGDPLDRKVTLRDILDSGIGRLKPGMRPGQDGNLDSGALPPAPDLSIPPAPANFDAQGGFYGMINLSWTIPGQQYRNHAYTNIFRSEEDNFANAEVIGREAGGFYTDYVRDDAVDPDDPTKLKGYYYWITFTSVADIEGPPNSPNGTYAAPLADLGYVIELLTGQIDAGVLATALRQEIEKIPAIESNIERLGPIEAELRGPESLDGTVANRIAAERDARIQAVDNERAERVDSLLAEQEARQDAISFEAQARQDAIQAEVQDRVAAVAAERDARVAALQAEQGARAAAITSVEQQLVDGDTALSNQLTTLTSVVDGNSADITNEQQARVSGDEALASDITTLQTQVGDNEAAIINESQARIENDALRASQLAVITATYNANTASIYSLEEVRIGDREATATRIDGLEVKVDDNEATLLQEQIARANADSALASQISVLSAKIDALPTFANGFEAGLEFDRWVAASGHSITAETNDAFSGDQSALVSSTSNSVATSSAPFAVSARIPNGTADAFAGHRVRVGIAARALSGGSAEFAIGYATSGGWFSGWHRHEPAAGWGIFEAQIEVPEVTNEDHYVIIWGDTSGGGGSVEVDRLLIDVADTEIPEITAQIETLQQAIADNQQAMATQFNALSSQFDTSIATVNGELTTLSTADEALASNIQTLQAEIDNNAAAIVDEQTTRATETDALAQQLNAVDARVDQSRALITSEAQSRADEDSALAQQINAVDARVDGSRSLITSEQQARADGDSALASDIQTLTAVTGDLAADIQSESTVRASADEALAEDVTDLWAGVGENEARITDEARVRATEDDLLAAVQRVISASRGTASATFYSLNEVRLADSAATALRIDGVEVQLGDAFSAIELEQSLRASEDQALATQITTAVAELDGDISTVQQTLNTEVTRLDGRVDAQSQLLTAVQSDINGQLATVQQNFNTEVSRIDDDLNANAQAITDVQSATDNALAGVQQDFNTEIARVDDAIDANANAITEARTDLGSDIAGVQQSLTTNVSRIDGELQNNAQAITTAQSQLGGQISTVQQNLSSEISRVDGEIEATAQLVQSVQTDLGSGLNAVEIKAVTNAGGILSNGQFATGDLSGWGTVWGGVDIIAAGSSSVSAIESAPTKYIAAWNDTAWSSVQIMSAESFSVKGGEQYNFRISYATDWQANIPFDVRVAWTRADGSTTYPAVLSASANSIYWKTSSVVATRAPDDAVEGRLYIRRLAGGSGTLFIADVRAFRTDMVVGSLYTAKVQSSGLIGGFGLYNDGAEVDAGFDVDRFWVGRTNDDKRKPFIIDGDVVYMNTAMIRNGSIQEGQLGAITIGKFFLNDGTPVTTAGGLIRAEAIDVDNLSVAEAARFYADVQSGNYIPGQSGWRIRQNGNVEFNEGQFNGTVEVTGGTLSDDVSIAGVDSLGLVRERAYAGSLAKSRADSWTRPDSTLIDGNKIFTGDAYVDTLQIKGDAVSVPLSASFAGIQLGSQTNGIFVPNIVNAPWVTVGSISTGQVSPPGSPGVNGMVFSSFDVFGQATSNGIGGFALDVRVVNRSSGVVQRQERKALDSATTTNYTLELTTIGFPWSGTHIDLQYRLGATVHPSGSSGATIDDPSNIRLSRMRLGLLISKR